MALADFSCYYVIYLKFLLADIEILNDSTGILRIYLTTPYICPQKGSFHPALMIILFTSDAFCLTSIYKYGLLFLYLLS